MLQKTVWSFFPDTVYAVLGGLVGIGTVHPPPATRVVVMVRNRVVLHLVESAGVDNRHVCALSGLILCVIPAAQTRECGACVWPV